MVEVPRMTPTAVNFFAKVTRFEFAMKNIDQFRIVAANRGVTPNWDSLANFLFQKQNNQAFFQNLAADKTTRYLIGTPPKKRIVNQQNNLDWSDPPDPLSNIREVCMMIRRVRNNLAHGDKANPGAERNWKLLSAASNILDRILVDNPALYNFYQF